MSDFESFLQSLASSQPVPGGGTVAALEAAMGAALLVMVSDLTIGRKRYASVQERVQEIRARALNIMEEASRLAELDARAYGRVSEALSLPRETESDRAARLDTLQEALKGAVEPPLRTMTLAGIVLEASADLVGIGNRSAVSDVGTSALCAQAAYMAAGLNVEINLAAIKDPDWVNQARARVPSVQAAALAAEVVERAQRIIAGEVQ